VKENNRYHKPKTHKRSTALGVFRQDRNQAACHLPSKELTDDWEQVTCKLCLKMKPRDKVKTEQKAFRPPRP